MHQNSVEQANSSQPGRPWVSSTVRCLLCLMLGWVGVLGFVEQVQAGCSGFSGTHLAWQRAKPQVGGQLELALYVRYERGSLSFTYEPPVKPCEGPNCRPKSSLDPSLIPVVGPRLVMTQPGFDRSTVAVGETPSLSYPRARSRSAPRGYLEVSEPPPKISI
jgi:hypothetical protein